MILMLLMMMMMVMMLMNRTTTMMMMMMMILLLLGACEDHPDVKSVMRKIEEVNSFCVTLTFAVYHTSTLNGVYIINSLSLQQNVVIIITFIIICICTKSTVTFCYSFSLISAYFIYHFYRWLTYLIVITNPFKYFVMNRYCITL
jgi:hypothetical protein